MKHEDIKDGDVLFLNTKGDELIEVVVSEVWDYSTVYIKIGNNSDSTDCDSLYRYRIDFYNEKVEQINREILKGDFFAANWEKNRKDLLQEINIYKSKLN